MINGMNIVLLMDEFETWQHLEVNQWMLELF